MARRSGGSAAKGSWDLGAVVGERPSHLALQPPDVLFGMETLTKRAVQERKRHCDHLDAVMAAVQQLHTNPKIESTRIGLGNHTSAHLDASQMQHPMAFAMVVQVKTDHSYPSRRDFLLWI